MDLWKFANGSTVCGPQMQYNAVAVIEPCIMIEQRHVNTSASLIPTFALFTLFCCMLMSASISIYIEERFHNGILIAIMNPSILLLVLLVTEGLRCTSLFLLAQHFDSIYGMLALNGRIAFVYDNSPVVEARCLQRPL
jgi:hypothetical protein